MIGVINTPNHKRTATTSVPICKLSYIVGLVNRIQLELLRIKHSEKNADLTIGYCSYRDQNYKDSIQISTDASNDPQTNTSGSAVAVSLPSGP